ncbi:flagellar protein FliT [Pelosinus baikalensis]|uniref:Flagellar protein FliT n=1 Tax=Pelosinus baikalensis TaxID=2892015 RepID=A0ABS8HPK8_9FIRM|nr:flagellar protein FliT [Pelosinus baikalensis]MCC5464042.1 flagellar protein FliT [Pelosinus baikalensis]
MQYKEKELHFIKHCNNLLRLSAEQLVAIKEEKSDVINELTIQKQMVIDGISDLQKELDISNCHLDIKEKLKATLKKVTGIENESQQIVRERCARISKQMLANRKEMSIQQAYEEGPFQVQGTLCNIEK